MTDNEYLKFIGGRKFIITLLIISIVTILKVLESIDQETFKTIIMSIGLIYVSGNVAQKVFTLSDSTSALKDKNSN
jgi:hypothetical protein